MSNRLHIRPTSEMAMAYHLLSIAERQGDCLVLDPGSKEYPQVQFAGKSWQAHRFVFHVLIEKVSEAEDVHHECENKPCIRPSHLQKLLRAEHLKVHDQSSFNREKSHCPHGHVYTANNLIPNKHGKRVCRECNRIRARNRWRDKHWK